MRTAGHPQPGLGDYGFEFRAVAVFPPTAFDQTRLGYRVCSQTGNEKRIGWRACKLGFGGNGLSLLYPKAQVQIGDRAYEIGHP